MEHYVIQEQYGKILIIATQRADGFEIKKWLLSALIFSWIGDIILMFADKGELYFIFGLVSLLIAHILFIILFVKQKTEAKPTNKIIFGFGLLLVSIYIVKYAMAFVSFVG